MRKTKEEAEKTKQEILDSAVKVFAEKGYFNATLEDIARPIGLTRGAVYWHFKNKVEIFDALFDQLHQPIVQMVMQDLQQDHPNPLEQIKTLCIYMLQDVQTNDLKRQALSLFMVRCDYSGELEPYKSKHLEDKREKMQMFASYFERAIKKGQIDGRHDPLFLTTALCCYMKGILLEYLNDPDNFDMQSSAPNLMNYYFGLLVPAYKPE